MSVKLKYSEKNDAWTLKGLQWEHIQVLAALLVHTRLGTEVYEHAAFEMISAIEKDQGEIDYLLQDMQVNFYREKEDGTIKEYGDDMGIALTEPKVSW